MPVKLDVIARGPTAAIDRNSPKARQDKWMLEVERAMLTSVQPHAPASMMPVLADVAAATIAPADAEQSPGVNLAAGRPARGGAQPSLHSRAHATAAGAPSRTEPGKRGDPPVAMASALPGSATGAQQAVGEGEPSVAHTGDVTGAPANPAMSANGVAAFASARYEQPGRMNPMDLAPSGGAPMAESAHGPAAATDQYGGSATAAPVARGPADAGLVGAGAPAAVVHAGAMPVAAAVVPAVAAAVTVGVESAPVKADGPSGARPPASVGVDAATSFVPARGLTSSAGVPAGAPIPAIEMPAPEEHEAAAPSRRVLAQTDGEPYAPSNVHVIDGEEGIHAWVRDARMTPHQEQAVAQALVAQFVQQGAFVGSVTVNGRLHDTRAGTEQDEQDQGHSTSEAPATAADFITTVRGAA